MKIKFLCFPLAAALLSSCALFKEPPAPVRIDPDSYTYQKFQKESFERLENYRVTVNSGTSIADFLTVLNNAGIYAGSALRLNDMTYTGPTLTSVSVLEALEIVLGYTVLDFDLVNNGIVVVPSTYKRISAKSKMRTEDWMLVLETTDKMLLKDAGGSELKIGFVLDDRVSQVFMVNAPLSVRYKISEFINEYNSRKTKDNSPIHETDNVQVGVIERVSF